MQPINRDAKTNDDVKTVGSESHRGRTLILCFDGTSNEYDQKNTNVVRLFSCLEKSHPKQLVYYQTGIGTYSTTKYMTTFGTWISKVVDQGVAWNLEEHVCNGYRFLQSRWQHGDKICIFGFSRGAYTARALAGMLHAVGLLPASMPDQVQFAYKLYVGLGSGDSKMKASKNYMRDFSRPVAVDFLGVWDTVASVGLLVPRVLPFSQNNSTIKVFRHAMALDERRVKFIPSPWRLSLNAEGHEDAFTRFQNKVSAYSQILGDIVSLIHCTFHFLSMPFAMFIPLWASPKPTEKKLTPMGKFVPDILEVWFAGSHCDVGGGNAIDEAKRKEYSPALANIPLRWMISELHDADIRHGLKIRWRHKQLPYFGIDLPPIDHNETDLNPDYLSRMLDDGEGRNSDDLPFGATFERARTDKNGVRIDLKFHDDDLKQEIQDAMWRWNGIFPHPMMLMWWIFEIIPFITYSRNKITQEWESGLRWNLFRPREVPKDAIPPLDELEGSVSGTKWEDFINKRSKVRYHDSVSERMNCMELKKQYEPAVWKGESYEAADWEEWPSPN